MSKPKPTAPRIRQVDTTALIPNPRNSKKHDDIQVAKIAGSIKEFGFGAPIITDGDNGILAGHGRWLAAQKLGLEKVPCVEMGHLSDSYIRNGIKDAICDDCGKEWTVRKDTSPKVCTRCASVRGGKASDNKPPIKKKTIKRKPCPTCGKGIRITDGYTYCSVACRMSDKREQRTCKTCKKGFSVLKSSISPGTNSFGNFCGRMCYEKWLCKTDRVSGRGSQWKKIRARAINQNPFCAICGTVKNLQVHHIIPFRLTQDNDQSNLIPICTRHHKSVESITHDVEFADTDLSRVKFILTSMLKSRQMQTKSVLKKILHSDKP